MAWTQLLTEANTAELNPLEWAAAERDLVLELLQFIDVIEHVMHSSNPHMLCDYLYRVATSFHAFYEVCPVLTQETGVMKRRLVMCAMTKQVLKTGLGLLGIPIVTSI